MMTPQFSDNFLVHLFTNRFIDSFYPTALKGCWGIVFTHGVRMGGRAGGRTAGKEFVWAVSQKP